MSGTIIGQVVRLGIRSDPEQAAAEMVRLMEANARLEEENARLRERLAAAEFWGRCG